MNELIQQTVQQIKDNVDKNKDLTIEQLSKDGTHPVCLVNSAKTNVLESFLQAISKQCNQTSHKLLQAFARAKRTVSLQQRSPSS